MFQIKAKLLYNKRVKDEYLCFAFEAREIAKRACPGQFVNIRIIDNYAPLLRRPFSIHRIRGKNIEIFYEVVGQGTEILTQKKAGEYIDIIGPLGNGFDYPTPYTLRPTPILIAGGMGVAPLIFLAEKLTERKTQNSKHKTLVLIGAKTKKQILCEEEFKKLGCAVKIATDDGSRGFKGYVSELLKKIVSSIKHQASSIYACGPKPMLKEVSRISGKFKISAQISLEEHLACGIGACLGCMINTKDGYKRVCKEGPVFAADEIIWSKED